jgi:hypothetical protein
VPAAQKLHVAELALVAKVPGEQDVHDDACGKEKEPFSHAVQKLLDEFAANVPAAHGKQLVWPVSDCA